MLMLKFMFQSVNTFIFIIYRKLVIYPNGRGSGKDGEAYVSVYLVMANITDLPSNWEVTATFSIYLFNHISDDYRYSIGIARRFHALNPERGFIKFISKKDLTDPLNGYLFDDKCVLGAEVFVNGNKTVTECVSLKGVGNEPFKQEFKISNFSRLRDPWTSDEFKVGGHKWVIDIYPNGIGKETGRSLSIFLRHVVSNNCANSERVRSCYTVRIKDQLHYLNHHQMTSSGNWFSASTSSTWGWSSFIELSSLNDPNKGFIVNNCCLLEVELVVQAISS
ncbi:hypothetical protein CASFOL_012391 [Castilleja foliolosa]|uniref:MATH domain-containing protein n=1 Tax=Castilleja foliolosa TaxID=1961234 RepID=A0ABD3DKZ2_9LAMI